MATSRIFDGKRRYLPGPYSTMKSGVKNSPTANNFGAVLLIDTGLGAGFGSGSGINGELKSGADSVYSLEEISLSRKFEKGGPFLPVVQALFKPYGSLSGINKLYRVRAATTVGATLTFAPTGATVSGGTVTPGANGGTLVIKLKDEGTVGNGVVLNSTLTRGYGATLTAGVLDTSKFILKFWLGSFTGLDSFNVPWDGISESASIPTLLCQSIEFNNISDLITWCQSDSDFNTYFKVSTSSITGTGAVTSGDLAAITNYLLASGGTESYSNSDLLSVLSTVKDLNYDVILSDQFGSNATSTINMTLLDHIENEARFRKYLWVGGGFDSSTFSSGTGNSITTAQTFDSQRVITVHGGLIKNVNYTAEGTRKFTSLVKAAYVLGRQEGIDPQNPLTYKGIDIDGETHVLSEDQKISALKYGVLVTYYDSDLDRYCVLQGVNTLQNNSYYLNEDTTSFSIQLNRIITETNRTLEIQSKVEVFGQESGMNRNMVSSSYMKTWTEGKLKNMCCTSQKDNLLISYQDVVVTKDEDNYNVSYGCVVNGEITKIFFTGVILGY